MDFKKEMEKLTLAERLGLALSAWALIVSVLSPIVCYFALQNTVREQALKGRSLVAFGEVAQFFAFPTKANPFPEGSSMTYTVTLKNRGPLAIDNVGLAFRWRKSEFKKTVENVRINPPIPSEITTTDQELHVQFKHPIPPGQEIELVFGYKKSDVKDEVDDPAAWLWSDSNVATPIVWRDQLDRLLDEESSPRVE